MPSSDSATAVPRLAGRRILLTGASSGVGLAAVERFAREDARLVLVARRDRALRDELARRGLTAHVVRADVGVREEARDAVREAVAHLGGLDAVVSNAAVATFGHVAEVHPDDFDRTLAVTFTGAVDVIREALPHLRRSQGTILATGSLMTRVPLPTWSSYASAKHALRGFLNSIAVEEREQRTGVRVAMVHPGPIDTPLWAQASSATGRKPRVPPDAYRAEVIAQALVESVVRPRGEVILGGETVAMSLLFEHARPVAERILVFIDRWYRSGDERASLPGSLWRTEDLPARTSGGMPARDSLLAPLQLGLRMLPSPLTPLRLVRGLGATAARAVTLRHALTRPTRELPAPANGLHEAPDAPAPAPARVTI